MIIIGFGALAHLKNATDLAVKLLEQFAQATNFELKMII
jgi:hypothetical protein